MSDPRYQIDVNIVTRCRDIFRTKIDPEGRDTKGGTRRCANFRRKIREGRQVVSVKCGGFCEIATGELHTIARVTGKADDHLIHLLARDFSVL